MQDNPLDQDLLAFPPSFAQQRLWLLDQLAPGSTVYNITIPLRLTGALNVAALEVSLNDIVQRHEVLRTTFRVIDDEPVQVVNDDIALPLPITDLTSLPLHEHEPTLKRLIWDEASLPFDLQRGPLFRVSLLRLDQTAHVLLLSMHHIISDAWSLSVLVRELTTLYTAHLNGRSDAVLQLPELPIQYADFSVWQREHLDPDAPGGVLAQQLSYWKQQLAGLPILELPTDRPRPPTQTTTGLRMTTLLPKPLAEQLTALSQREGVTLFMTLLAAFSALLQRYSGQDDIVVGTPIANRTRSELKGLIGFFVNTLVLRADLGADPTFRELLQQVRATALAAYAHQDVPFEKLVEELQPQRDPSRTAFFQVMLALQNTASITLDLPGLHIEELPVENGTAKFDLTVTLEERASGLLIVIDYNTDLFDTATIERLVEHFQTLLESIVAAPELPGTRRVSELPLLNEAERQQVLADWNATAQRFVGPTTLHGLVAAQATRTPDAVALRYGDQTLSYAALDERANQLAHYLRGLGIGPETRVGVCLERSLELVVALLGVLKAGAAYVPLDPAYPVERLQFMVDDAQLGVLLTQAHLRSTLPYGATTVLALDADWPTITQQPTSDPAVFVDGEHPAYIIYTSGSTGRPKGALIPHRAIVNHMQWMQQTFPLDARDRVLQKTPISFDASVWEFYAPLLAGAELVLARPGGHQDAAYLVATIQQNGITILQLVPTLLRLLTEEANFAACTSLRRVFCGGEALLSELVAQFRTLLPATELHNLYGPTEAAIDSTSWHCGDERGASAPIGRPVANMTAYVLDARMEPVPVGVAGELYLGGAQLARGYLNRPALTAEKFVPDPFNTDPGARLYRTGDRVRHRADGAILFLGRVDFQVKLRGLRIELGEIEAVLRAQPGVREVVVVVREEQPGDQRLVAYVETSSEGPVTSAALRSALAAQMPEYMLPSAMVLLPTLPLTPNGKIDRHALPAPDHARDGLGDHAEAERVFVAPRDALELQLAQIWEDLLHTQPIGITDNFFALGGHSLLAMRLIAQIQKQFDRKLPLSVLFQAGTIDQLAVLLRQQHANVSHSPLVRMQAGDGKSPFFCIHPVGGHILCYLDLVRQLDSDQPVYGLQAPGLEREDFQPLQLPQIAAEYSAAIRSVQPEGPYLLGGWSFGGVVAFEIAQQLQQQGQEVDLLALIDSYPNAAGDEAEAYDDETPMASFAWYLRSVFDLDVADEALQPLDREAQLQYILDRARQAHIFPPDAELAYLYRLLDVFKENMRAVQRYTPQRYPKQITLFRASEQLVAGLADPVVGWRALAEGGLDLRVMPGNHVTMIRQPHVQALARELQACLHKARYAAD